VPDVWAFDHSAGILRDASHRRAKPDQRNAKIERDAQRSRIVRFPIPLLVESSELAVGAIHDVETSPF
jgi:hypothetical protein